DCSREKVEKALISVGKTELDKMADEDENTEVCCQFCDKKYNFSSDEIRDLAQKADSSDDDEE
ncbi:Hsp33 family molecular chaperone HslO, partial [Salmonella enterica]|uniref:Hsp33 family molecular chaperone HslO n=1 Tax=Salmonella enterica TaxID=28901 RepID=UPI0020C55A35